MRERHFDAVQGDQQQRAKRIHQLKRSFVSSSRTRAHVVLRLGYFRLASTG